MNEMVKNFIRNEYSEILECFEEIEEFPDEDDIEQLGIKMRVFKQNLDVFLSKI